PIPSCCGAVSSRRHRSSRRSISRAQLLTAMTATASSMVPGICRAPASRAGWCNTQISIPPQRAHRKLASTFCSTARLGLAKRSMASSVSSLLGREVNLSTEKKEVGKPGDFDHMADEELTEFIEKQGELVRELERQLLPSPSPKQGK